ncbi:hypothetical protein [Microcoleus sp. herbarium5]|uniref:hypothetical protein n=1 Tax=Microcoleus sp. herbarium5 TaxID=3055434 RepID=UPI002FD271A5
MAYLSHLQSRKMTINKARKLLEATNSSKCQLLDCLEDLAKEYGYIQGMTIGNLRDLVSGKKTLAEIQDLIEQIKQKIKCTN